MCHGTEDLRAGRMSPKRPLADCQTRMISALAEFEVQRHSEIEQGATRCEVLVSAHSEAAIGDAEPQGQASGPSRSRPFILNR